MAGPAVQAIGNGQYRTTVNGHTYTFSAAPGIQIIVGGQKVTTPPQPQYAPGTPFLNPEEQQQFNSQLGDLANQEIDLNFAVGQAHTNYERTVADLARNALISTQSVEESMAARGQYDSGIRSSALTDVQATKALNQARASEDLRSADILYESKRTGINNARGQLQNWYTLAAGRNAADSPAPPPNYSTGVSAPSPASTKLPTVKPPAPRAPAYPGGPASGAQYQATLPSSATHVGRPVPATKTTYASGSPPGKGYKWNGVRWVKK